jgi:protein gp37
VAENSKIEWTDNTFNPWHGCVNVSPACDNCYAEIDSARNLHGWGNLWGKDAARHITSDAYWRQPLTWNRQAEREGIRKRVFCGSMCDVMERRDDLNEPRQRLFKLIEDTPNLDWLLLTKRPQEYRHFLPLTWRANPLPNVWLMTTVESQDYVWRIGELMKVPAAVYGVSIEPMLSLIVLPSEFLQLGTRGWVIAGGESGRSNLRPTPIEWFRFLRDQAVPARVPFHFKQWGEFNSELVKIGKKKAGRELDGRTWDELPVGTCEDENRQTNLSERDKHGVQISK